MVNKNLLKSKQVLNGDTDAELAAALGISPQTYSAKINGKVEFIAREIKDIRNRYQLSDDDVMNIFFAD